MKIVYCIITLITVFSVYPQINIEQFTKEHGEGSYRFKDGHIEYSPIKAKTTITTTSIIPPPPVQLALGPAPEDTTLPKIPTNIAITIKKVIPQPQPPEPEYEPKLPINSKVIVVQKVTEDTLYYFGEGWFEGMMFAFENTLDTCDPERYYPFVEIDRYRQPQPDAPDIVYFGRETVFSCEWLEWGLSERIRAKYDGLNWELVSIDSARKH